MSFHAHSTQRADKSDWEPLPAHLNEVATLAEAFGTPFGLGRAARLAGLLHDLGKFDPAFQRRLTDDRIRVDHSTAGAALLMAEAKGALAAPARRLDRVAVQLAAAAVAGHHAGLPDRRGSDAALDARVAGFDLDRRLDASWRAVLPLDLSSLFPAGFRPSPERLFFPFQIALLGRMLFSALVDADRKAAEAFEAAREGRRPDRDWPTLAEVLPAFLEGFERRMARFGAPGTPLARLRAEILAHVRGRAAMEPGLFTLSVPTGGGKTLASLGFALDHAAHHNRKTDGRFRRIICAIPFTSVTEQTAAQWREALGGANVLEHHSGFEPDKEPARAKDADSASPEENRLRLAMEDWAAPVVVTTHVQLFESLFAARPSRARKLHNIANSVVILDEAQVLPLGLLGPTVRCIDELARNYGCTVVLCTATQPAFDACHFAGGNAASPLALDLKGRELAPDPPALHRALRRAVIRRADAPLADRDLVEALAGRSQAFVIVNSRPHARALHELASARGLEGLVHLSTRQHAADRQRILADVRRRLETGAPCRLVSTSLVEAGVDFDFPVGWRAETGMDSIVQAAGRVNREGRRPLEASILTVFQPADAKPPLAFARLIEKMRHHVSRHPDDPASPEAMTDYFREVYWNADEGIDAKRILCGDMMTEAPGIGAEIAYRTIAERYRMVEIVMVPVIVPPAGEEERLREMLAAPKVPSGAIARKVQPYTVQTPRGARGRLLAAGDVALAEPRLRGDQFPILTSRHLYAPEIGLLWENAGDMATEDMIV